MPFGPKLDFTVAFFPVSTFGPQLDFTPVYIPGTAFGPKLDFTPAFIPGTAFSPAFELIRQLPETVAHRIPVGGAHHEEALFTGLLNTSVNIDSTSPDEIVLAIPQEGFVVQIFEVVLTVDDASGITVPARASVTIASGGSDIIAEQDLIGLEAAGDSFTLETSGKFRLAVAEDKILLRIVTGATGTSQTLKAEVWGMVKAA